MIQLDKYEDIHKAIEYRKNFGVFPDDFDPYKSDQSDWYTALHAIVASIKFRQISEELELNMVEELVKKHGVPVNSKQNYRNHLLSRCADNGAIKIAKFLIKSGMDPFEKDVNGNSAAAHIRYLRDFFLTTKYPIGRIGRKYQVPGLTELLYFIPALPWDLLIQPTISAAALPAGY